MMSAKSLTRLWMHILSLVCATGSFAFFDKRYALQRSRLWHIHDDGQEVYGKQALWTINEGSKLMYSH